MKALTLEFSIRAFIFGLTASLLLPAQTPEIQSSAKDRSDLSLTIYQDGWAMVRDRRRVDLPKGPSRLAFSDVAALMNPRTALLRTLQTEDELRLGERNFEFDLITPENLLKKSLGTKVLMKVPNEGGRSSPTGPIEGILASLPQQDLWSPIPTAAIRKLFKLHRWEWEQKKAPFRYRLIKAEPNVLVQTPEGLSAAKPGDVALTALPNELRAHPTLLQDFAAPTEGPRDLELDYLTQALTWSARYVATLDPDLRHMDLDCFVTVDNQSGVSFEKAQLSLLAGEVNRVPDRSPFEEEEDATTTVVVVASVAVTSAPTFKEQQLLDYHLFTWGAPTTLKQAQKKQLVLFSAQRIPLNPVIQTLIYLDGRDNHAKDGNEGEEIPLWLTAQFKNTVASHLGRPLPQGMVAAIYRTPEGPALPLPDEILLDSVSKGEEAILGLGSPHGLSAKLVLLESREETQMEIAWRLKGIMAKVFLQSTFTQKTFEEAAQPYEKDGPPGHIATYRLDLRNELAQPKQMELILQMEEGMKLLRADTPHEKQDAASEKAKVILPAHSKTSLTLQVWRPN